MTFCEPIITRHADGTATMSGVTPWTYVVISSIFLMGDLQPTQEVESMFHPFRLVGPIKEDFRGWVFWIFGGQ